MTAGVEKRKWDQFALIAYFSKEIGSGHQFGKKALQKTVHLLDEFANVETGYRFGFYTYGPYSSELMSDLDLLKSFNAVDVTYNATDNYYLIRPGQEAEKVIERGKGFIESSRKELDVILKLVQGRTAKDLELVSTIVYLQHRDKSAELKDIKLLSKRVLELKPKYNEEQVIKAANEIDSARREIAAH